MTETPPNSDENRSFQALRAFETEGGFSQRIVSRHIEELPDHDVLVRVHWSSLNYKDALSAFGNKGVTRAYPHTPGIDAAGVVVSSRDTRFAPGAQVIVTSHDLGMNTPGGLAEYIRVPGDWIVPLPAGLSLRASMVLGTAGLTAGMALHKLERGGQTPAMGPIVVTGASGGVGSLAVALLAACGYEVHAVSGRPELHAWLRNLGASACLSREEVSDTSSRPLLRSRWAGAIDTVGGAALSTLIRACAKEGSIAVCGLVASPEFAATVFPFILNGVQVLGIDSAECPQSLRQRVWEKLGSDWRLPQLDDPALDLLEELTLAEVPAALAEMHAGRGRGRRIVRLA